MAAAVKDVRSRFPDITVKGVGVNLGATDPEVYMKPLRDATAGIVVQVVFWYGHMAPPPPQYPPLDSLICHLTKPCSAPCLCNSNAGFVTTGFFGDVSFGTHHIKRDSELALPSHPRNTTTNHRHNTRTQHGQLPLQRNLCSPHFPLLSQRHALCWQAWRHCLYFLARGLHANPLYYYVRHTPTCTRVHCLSVRVLCVALCWLTIQTLAAGTAPQRPF